MQRFVGVSILSPGTAITNPGFTTGTDRMVPLIDAHDTIHAYTEPTNKIVGEGTYGKVEENTINPIALTRPSVVPGWFKAIVPSTTTTSLPKYVIKNSRTRNGVIQVEALREFALRNLDHPNIIAIHAVHFGLQAGQSNVYADTQISMECMSMDLWTLCHTAWNGDNIVENGEHTCFADNELRLLAYQMLTAVSYVHSKLIIHGDIKLENFLVTSIGLPEATHKDIIDFALENRPNDAACRTFKVVKLCDFGMCSPNHHEHRRLDAARIGTMEYRSPELDGLIPGLGRMVSFSSDVWALGLALYSMVQFTYLLPDARMGLMAPYLRTQITKGGPYHPNAFPSHPQYVESVVAPLVQMRPWDRAPAAQILQSAYFTSPAKNIAGYVQRALNLTDAQQALTCPYRFDYNHMPRMHPIQAVQVMYQNQAYICSSTDKAYFIRCSRNIRVRVYQNLVDIPTTTSGMLEKLPLWVLREVDAKAHALACNFLGLCADAKLNIDPFFNAAIQAIIAMAFMLVGNAQENQGILRTQTPAARNNPDRIQQWLIKSAQHDVLAVLDCDIHMASIWDILMCAVETLKERGGDALDLETPLKTVSMILLHDPDFACQYDSYSIVTMCLDCLLNLKYRQPLSTPQPNWWYPPTIITTKDVPYAGRLVGYAPLTDAVAQKIVTAVQQAVWDEGDKFMHNVSYLSYNDVVQNLQAMWNARSIAL
jgi:serine/threonine protein kinase